jgi:hypothetical protein
VVNLHGVELTTDATDTTDLDRSALIRPFRYIRSSFVRNQAAPAVIRNTPFPSLFAVETNSHYHPSL